MGTAGIDKRAAQIRLTECVRSGLLTRPKRGWYALPESSAIQPMPSVPAPAQPRPAVVALPVQAVVITAMPPSQASHAVDVVAACSPAATTTTTCTTSATPPTPPEFDDLMVLIDERSAIMEYDGGLDRETADRLAREMVLGRDAAVIPAAPPAVDVVSPADPAVLHARQQPYVGAVLGRLPGVVQSVHRHEAPSAAPPDPQGRRQPGQCQCGHDDRWVQVRIHEGQSVRVDCGHCDRFGWFAVWRGQRLAGPDNDTMSSAVAVKAAGRDRLSFVAGENLKLPPRGAALTRGLRWRSTGTSAPHTVAAGPRERFASSGAFAAGGRR